MTLILVPYYVILGTIGARFGAGRLDPEPPYLSDDYADEEPPAAEPR